MFFMGLNILLKKNEIWEAKLIKLSSIQKCKNGESIVGIGKINEKEGVKIVFQKGKMKDNISKYIGVNDLEIKGKFIFIDEQNGWKDYKIDTLYVFMAKYFDVLGEDSEFKKMLFNELVPDHSQDDIDSNSDDSSL